jgi:hypothetical protein
MNSDNDEPDTSTDASPVEHTDSGDDAATRPGPSPIDDRYGTLELGDETVVVHDRESPGAWLESDRAVPVGGGLDG